MLRGPVVSTALEEHEVWSPLAGSLDSLLQNFKRTKSSEYDIHYHCLSFHSYLNGYKIRDPQDVLCYHSWGILDT